MNADQRKRLKSLLTEDLAAMQLDSGDGIISIFKRSQELMGLTQIKPEESVVKDLARRLHQAAQAMQRNEDPTPYLADVPLPPLSGWANEPMPKPVLWRDYDAYCNPVLSMGEVALLSGAGGGGKSHVCMALAEQSALAKKAGNDFGRACGLRVRPGSAVVVSYEDSPGRLVRQQIETIPDGLHVWPEPEPLMQASVDSMGQAVEGDKWMGFWWMVRQIGCSLVIIDPASAALADAEVSQSGPVRKFMRGLAAEAKPDPEIGWEGCGVLVVTHSTKGARRGEDSSGIVAGSAAWMDSARGVLSMTKPPRWPRESRLLRCEKCNYGGVGWGAVLWERRDDKDRWRGFELRPDTLTIDQEMVEELDVATQKAAKTSDMSGVESLKEAVTRAGVIEAPWA